LRAFLLPMSIILLPGLVASGLIALNSG
jgi:hypothetical protein